MFTLTVHLFKELCEEINVWIWLVQDTSISQCLFNISHQSLADLKGVCDFLHNRRKQSSFITGKPEQVLLSSSERLLWYCMYSFLCHCTFLESFVGIYHGLIWTCTVRISLAYRGWLMQENPWKKSETNLWISLRKNGVISRHKQGWNICSLKLRSVTGCNSSCRGVFVGTQTVSNAINK